MEWFTWTQSLHSFIWISSCLVFSSAQLYLQPPHSTQGYFTNDEFVVTCLVPSDTGATGLSWHSPSGEIKDTTGRIHTETDSSESQESLRLVVLGVRMSDEGEYKCVAIQDGQEITKAFTLVVYRSISFAGTPSEQIATEGEESTNILCNAKAYPEPTVTWIFNRSSLKTDAKYTPTKTSLTIRNVTRQDDGIYGCQAVVVASKNSEIKRMSIRLRIKYPPEWIGDPDLTTVFAAREGVGSLTCQAKGYPVPNYEWLRNDEVISQDFEDFNITIENDRSFLSVLLENTSYFGDYLCRVSNELGSLEQTITLKQGDPPSSPKVLIQNSEKGVLYLKIIENEQSTLKTTKYVVQYKPSSEEEWTRAKTVQFGIGEPYAISSLKHDTEYSLRAAAMNSVGIGDYSAEISHHTEPIVPATVLDQESAHAGRTDKATHTKVNFYIMPLLLSLLRWLPQIL